MTYGRSALISSRGLLGFSWQAVFLFVCVFFFFGKVKDTFLSLFSGNSASEEKISQEKTKQISRVTVVPSLLKREQAAYHAFADVLYAAMDGLFTDKSKLRDLLQNYNVEEFKAIYKAFDVRPNHTFGITYKHMTLVEMIEYELNEWGDATLLQSLREKFSPSGLW